jgi:hypothetical protein
MLETLLTSYNGYALYIYLYIYLSIYLQIAINADNLLLLLCYLRVPVSFIF